MTLLLAAGLELGCDAAQQGAWRYRASHVLIENDRGLLTCAEDGERGDRALVGGAMPGGASHAKTEAQRRGVAMMRANRGALVHTPKAFPVRSSSYTRLIPNTFRHLCHSGSHARKLAGLRAHAR